MAVRRILGIDPGSRLTGYGIIDSDGRRSVRVAGGVIRAASSASTALGERLRVIHASVLALLGEFQPTEVAVERVFVHRNADSALKLGQARAAAICATFGCGASLHEYAPREIKLAIAGRGGAEKTQVAHMVAVLLGLRKAPAADEADALAIAICHAHSAPLRTRLAAAGRAGVAGHRAGEPR